MSTTQPRARRLATLIAVAAVAAGVGAAPAAASHDRPCEDGQITQAVTEVTGNTPLGYVCNPALYNGGRWGNYSELKSHVRQTMNACGDVFTNRNLTQAVIEVSGYVPRNSVCAKQIYQQHINEIDTTGFPKQIDWTKYKQGAYPSENAHKAVYLTLQGRCSVPGITQAVIEGTGRLPVNDLSTLPATGGQGGSQIRGQCFRGLYNNGELYDYDYVVSRVQARGHSSNTHTCANGDITRAVRELSGGWNPLPEDCDPVRYGGGSWGSYEELKSRIFASWRCRDPWIGQVYLFSTTPGRNVRGSGRAGECNTYLYGGGQWSSYTDLAQKAGVTLQALAAENLEVRHGGKVWHRAPGGVVVETPAQEVLVGNPVAGIISTGGGNLISDKGLGVIAPGGGNLTLAGGSVIAPGGGNVIAPGGGNLISDNGLGVIAPGGGNVIAPGGGNIISTGGLN